MAIKKLWNENWEFCEKPVAKEYYQIPAAADFKPVDIPHDWMIYDTKNLYRDSIGWYHKSFTPGGGDLTGKVSLYFDGVYMDSAVFVNGEQVGEWKYGYSAFEFDITKQLKAGANDVHVRVVFRHCNSRWYSGAGIFRDVWFKTYNENHILSDGVYISTFPLADGDFRVEIETEVHKAAGAGEFKVRQTFYAPDGAKVAADVADCGAVAHNDIIIKSPLLWDIGQGNLYTLKTELLKDDEVICIEENRFGFRILKFDAAKGFSINGRNIKLNGSCEHHDFGCLGAAYHQDAMRRKLEILRDMGVNSIRTAHNMPAKKMMELADEMGFLVVSEAFDTWYGGKTTYDYGRFFDEWCERDVRSWVRRDRNHASLLMWSIGNEIYETMQEKGLETTKRLVDAVRKHDPKKNAPTTIGSNYMKWEGGQKCSELVDIKGYNYGESIYDEHHGQHPDWIIYGSETSSMLASRGIYHFPLNKTSLSDEDEQCSALGNSSTGWGAASYEDTIFDDRDAKYSLGQYIWTGFDYIGESTPYQTKNSYFGVIDTAGFPKDPYYIFQAEWTDVKENPMIHIFPYWDFSEGQLIDVQVCTNAPECELFFNDISLGKRSINHLTDRKTVKHWQIPYETGRLYAVAYDENGVEIATAEKKSFGETKDLTVKASKETIKANGTDLIFVEIQAVDCVGTPVENARDRIKVSLSGAGRLLGLDNGDSPDFDQYKGISRRLFGGKLLAVIGAKTEPGEIIITLESTNIGKKELRLTVTDCDEAEKIHSHMENGERGLVGGGSHMPDLPFGTDEVPVRKIFLSMNGYSVLNPQNPSIDIAAKILPENASYQELEWKALNEAGIVIDYVDIEKTDGGAIITAKGDGEFRIRSASYNGGSSVSVMSELTLCAKGIGQAYLNPYKEILTGLCDVCRGSALAGIEQGTGFKGDGEGLVGFNYLDFGTDGTEEVTVAIFANTDNPLYLNFYDGDPALGGELILKAKYHVKHDWMVFKEMTFRFNRRLKGKKAIYISSSDFINSFKSLVFTEEKKAFSRLNASDCTDIYGDAFKRAGTCVANIGNNVLIDFTDMDFGSEGADKITICGSSPLEKSLIQVRFIYEEKADTQMFEFLGCDDYTERTMALKNIVTGKCKVSFVFLPGSNFNLAWFQFQKEEI